MEVCVCERRPPVRNVHNIIKRVANRAVFMPNVARLLTNYVRNRSRKIPNKSCFSATNDFGLKLR